jgi:hypothetical protein
MVIELPAADAVRDRSKAIQSVGAKGDAVIATLSNQQTISFHRIVGKHLRVGDLVLQSPSADGQTPDTLILKQDPRDGDLLHVSIGYAAKPQLDKRQRGLIRADVLNKSFGLSTIHLLADAVRDYFYAAQRGHKWDQQPSLYDVLRVSPSAKLGDLRLAYKIRHLEARVSDAPPSTRHAIERAFNILAHPELRQIYTEIHRKPNTPVLFPYAGFGTILVSGERSRDGNTFFARTIHSFRPNLRRRRLTLRLRSVNFQHDDAIYRDSNKKIEVRFDSVNLPIGWNPTWNTWKHLLSTKLMIEADFVQTGKYVKKSNAWQMVSYQTALPSSLTVTLPDGWENQTESALHTHHRFGQFSMALSHIRKLIEKEPMEQLQIRNLLAELRIPPDFEVERITWRPDYDPYFFQELRKRSRRFYLFRSEYIFELERVIAVEVPQFGHATYLYLRREVEEFVRLYSKYSRIEIRSNQGNVAEKLQFVGRIAHHKDRLQWLRDLRTKLGEQMDFVQAIS